MKKLYLIVLTVAVAAASCVKELGGETPDPNQVGTIPADFNWKTTRDAAVTVAAPVVDGVSGAANIRIYSSPLLRDENIVAKGVAAANGSFHAAITVPAGVADLYVKTTLADGAVSVTSVPVAQTIQVPGAIIDRAKVSPLPAKALVTRAKAVSGFDELNIPVVEEKTVASFDPQAVISTIEAGKNYQLGGRNPYYVADSYLIPAGAVITNGIDLNGDLKTARTLYVAGKLQLESLSIGAVTLAVLPGGEVRISGISTNRVVDTPCIYVFKGGKFVAGDFNLTNKIIVNKGSFEADYVDANNNTEIYNYSGAVMALNEVHITNSVVLHNDGGLNVEDAEANSNAKVYNWENGTTNISKFYSANGSVEFWQRGIAHFGDFNMSGGKFYFQCFTTIDKLSGDNGRIEIAAGTGVDVKAIDFNSAVKISLGSGSILTAETFKTGKADFTSEAKKNSDETPAVILITGEADCATWGTSFKGGPLEVVYNGKNPIDKKLFSNGSGAYQNDIQTVVLPATVCNGGKSPVNPEPDPLPEEEYSIVPGASYTYTFEDNWPWFGDYDMNDVVVLTSVDREVSKDGTKVASLRINWELKAAGSVYKNAFAMKLDKVASSQIASVESTYTGFGNGAFAAPGLEAGNEQAVIAFFNDTKELLSGYNTWKDRPYVATTKYTTTVKFAQPVASGDLVESALNFFIVAKQRPNEVHMPSYGVTAFADVLNKGDYHPSDPYKFFVASGDHVKDNYMMWAMRIPGNFRYPAESNDIRKVYKYFMPWATSGGAEHENWYEEEVDENTIY